jgi:hypothetical protein
VGRKYVDWPNSEMDRLVQRWADSKNIDFRKDVAEYQLNRKPGDLTTITLTMFFDDVPAKQEQKEEGQQ